LESSSRSFSSDSSCELHVLWHDGNSLGVDGAEVSVFEKSNHVGFSGLLEGEDGGALESKVILELRSDFSDESLERKLSDEELGALLEFSDFSECDCSWSESMWLLDSTGWGGGLLGLLVGDVLSWGFAASVLASSLLCSCHFKMCVLLNYNTLNSKQFIVCITCISGLIGPFPLSLTILRYYWIFKKFEALHQEFWNFQEKVDHLLLSGKLLPL
jgi:hypothetical protein